MKHPRATRGDQQASTAAKVGTGAGNIEAKGQSQEMLRRKETLIAKWGRSKQVCTLLAATRTAKCYK